MLFIDLINLQIFFLIYPDPTLHSLLLSKVSIDRLICLDLVSIENRYKAEKDWNVLRVKFIANWLFYVFLF